MPNREMADRKFTSHHRAQNLQKSPNIVSKCECFPLVNVEYLFRDTP